MTREQALALIETKWWEGKTARQIVTFQLFEERLCMPFDLFHKSVEEALGRPVFTHEFGLNHEGLQKEFLGEKAAPTLQQIIEMIPEAKRIIVIAP
jgi:hypothetical protein